MFTSINTSSTSSIRSSSRGHFTSFHALAVTFLALSSTFVTVQSAPILRNSLERRVGGEMSGGEMSKGDLYSIGIPSAPDSYWSAMAAGSSSSSSSAVVAQPTQALASPAAPVASPEDQEQEEEIAEVATVTPSSPATSPTPTAAMDRGALYSIGIPPPPAGFYQRK